VLLRVLLRVLLGVLLGALPGVLLAALASCSHLCVLWPIMLYDCDIRRSLGLASVLAAWSI
jgi:hypothetical protein